MSKSLLMGLPGGSVVKNPPGRIPWTGEPGRLQSMGSQRVRLDFVITHITKTGLLIDSERIERTLTFSTLRIKKSLRGFPTKWTWV